MSRHRQSNDSFIVPQRQILDIGSRMHLCCQFDALSGGPQLVPTTFSMHTYIQTYRQSNR